MKHDVAFFDSVVNHNNPNRKESGPLLVVLPTMKISFDAESLLHSCDRIFEDLRLQYIPDSRSYDDLSATKTFLSSFLYFSH